MPKKVYLLGILLHYFIQKKSASEAYRILVKTYDNHDLLKTTCRDWFRCFKNNDFDVGDKECSGAPKKFKDKELEALIHEDSCQAQAELAESLEVDHTTVSKCLKALGMIQKQVNSQRCQMMSCHVWTAASMAEKERFFALHCDWQWKVDTLQ